MLSLLSCTSTRTIQVQLLGLPADVARLEVTAELDGVSALEGLQSLTPVPERFLLQLSSAATGTLALHVSAADRGNCEVSAGDGVLQLRGAGNELVSLELSPRPGCLIDVEFVGGASGVVRVGGSGPTCSEGCQIPARRDELVTLSFAPKAGSILGGWFAPEAQTDCRGRGSCTIRVTNGVTSVKVASLSATSCAESGWCIEEETPALPGALYGLWGASRESIWAVGDAGTILHSDGFTWTSVSPVTSRALRGVWGSSAYDIWAVGELGTLLHYDGQTWTVQARATTSWLFAIWGSAADDIWAAGDGGTLLHWNGLRWSQVPTGVTSSLRGLWGSGPSSVWAVGDGGLILHYDGASFSALTSNTSVNLHGISGSGAQGIWVVGDFGTALRLGAPGVPPVQVSTGTSASLRSVFVPSTDAAAPVCTGLGACAIWAGGVGGVLVPLSETASSMLPVPSSFDTRGVINRVWGPSGRDVWAVGQGATIVRYRPQ